jgi:hypothetical protein
MQTDTQFIQAAPCSVWLAIFEPVFSSHSQMVLINFQRILVVFEMLLRKESLFFFL